MMGMKDRDWHALTDDCGGFMKVAGWMGAWQG